jgi:starch synthase
MGINVIYAASEAKPYAQTGGLADVAGALPAALKRLGAKVSVFLPYYREVASSGVKVNNTGLSVTVRIGSMDVTAEILKTSAKGVDVYFLKCDEYYDRTYLYNTPTGDYFDNLDRFAFFSRATLEAVIALKIRPGVIHCNDWQTGLIPVYLKSKYKKNRFLKNVPTLFTVHNTAYQGAYPGRYFNRLGLGASSSGPAGVELRRHINLLKAGVATSEIITTVSEGYSREIQTPEYGCGLEGLFKKRSADLFGVLNGADYNEWNPAVDKLIPALFSIKAMSGKAVCRRGLLKEFGLKLKSSTPVIGMVSRLAGQKGFDILSKAMGTLMGLDAGMVILGTGEKKYQRLLKELENRYQAKLAVRIDFDNRLAHMIEAGSDIFLMPSRYEPCGLNQIYSLKYGTIPVVRATGGLDDTVRDYGEGKGTGFKFKGYSAAALIAKLTEAVEVFKDSEAWVALRTRAMKEDFSWKKSAKKYMELYALAMERMPKV